MHTRLSEVMGYADKARAELLETVQKVDASRTLDRPADSPWSVRDVVEHLLLVEKSSLRALFRTLRNAKEKGIAQETETNSLQPLIDDVERRIKTGRRVAPDYTRPSSEATLPELVDQLKQSREGLHSWANEGDGSALDTISFPHPALGELSLYGWVVMLGAHERRHAEQIREIVTALGG
ncbi:MAG: DinB family protein [Gemmatimonadaceae bacterium]